MIDDKAVAKLIEQEIKRNVTAQVGSALDDPQWITDLENRIAKFVQDRITARFSNIATVPDLVKTVEHSVSKMFEDGFVPDLGYLVDNTLLAQAVDQAVENLVSDTMENLLLNEKWLDKIHNQIGRNMSDRIAKTLKEVGMRDVLRDVVLENTSTINKDINREITVENGLVVVKKHLSADSISADELDIAKDTSIHGSLTIDGDLAIKGRINVNNRSFVELAETIEKTALDKLKINFTETMSDQLFDRLENGINVKQLSILGKPLIDNDTLNSSITRTNITKLGKLDDLQVNTYLSVNNHRVGINTSSPTAALSIWDNEVNIELGKHSQNVAQIGTAKAHSLSLVTNNQQQLTINKDGLTWVKQLQVGRNKISTAQEVPGYEGAKGDLVFNSNYKQGAPFAWVCLGAFRWSELKSA